MYGQNWPYNIPFTVTYPYYSQLIKMATPTRFLQEGYCVPATYTLFSDGTKIVARYTGPTYDIIIQPKKQNGLNKKLFPMLWQARLVDSNGYAYKR